MRTMGLLCHMGQPLRGLPWAEGCTEARMSSNSSGDSPLPPTEGSWGHLGFGKPPSLTCALVGRPVGGHVFLG